MCFSASFSYGTAAVLLPAGIYAVRLARHLHLPYWVMGCAPIFFGIQQGFEGRVWQMLMTGDAIGAVPFALGFHFFSHFLWLWWIPLSSYVVEPDAQRRRLFLGIGLFGFGAGGLVYFSLLFNAGWLSVAVKHQSIIYDLSAPYRGPDLGFPLPASALYALIILVPLAFSSHRHLRVFGALVAASVVIASVSHGYAFVSVWCFFAAVLSIYLVVTIRRLASAAAP